MVKIHKILTGLALWGIISAGAVLCPVWAGAKTEKYTNTDFAMNTVVSETLYTTGKNLNPSVGELLKNTEEKSSFLDGGRLPDRSAECGTGENSGSF